MSSVHSALLVLVLAVVVPIQPAFVSKKCIKKIQVVTTTTTTTKGYKYRAQLTPLPVLNFVCCPGFVEVKGKCTKNTTSTITSTTKITKTSRNKTEVVVVAGKDEDNIRSGKDNKIYIGVGIAACLILIFGVISLIFLAKRKQVFCWGLEENRTTAENVEENTINANQPSMVVKNIYTELDKPVINPESQYQDLHINKGKTAPVQCYEVMPSPKLSARQKVIRKPCVYEVPNDSFRGVNNKFNKPAPLIVRPPESYQNFVISNNKQGDDKDNDYIDLTKSQY